MLGDFLRRVLDRRVAAKDFVEHDRRSHDVKPGAFPFEPMLVGERAEEVPWADEGRPHTLTHAKFLSFALPRLVAAFLGSNPSILPTTIADRFA